MPGNELSTSVVVCAYTMDRWSDIVLGMQALHRQSRNVLEILLIVDFNENLLARASGDLSARYPALTVLPSTGPAGLSGARNTGVTAARGDIVAFLDDDAEPELNWLARLIEPFDDPQVMVTGGRAIPRWPTTRPPWFPEEFDWVVGSSYRGMPTQRAQVRNVIGASMAIRRDAFAVAGLFADGVGRTSVLPLGCEETELCIRLRREIPDAKIVYVPHSIVQHRVSPDRTRLRYYVRRCFAEGLSKDQISVLVGNDAATSTERSYATRTLPLGVLREIRSAARGDTYGFARAAMIAVGLAVTAYGFARSKALRSAALVMKRHRRG